jgi:hypothetical protein
VKLFKNWLIKKLGGVTSHEYEEARVRYEKWAVTYLAGKNNEVTPDTAFYIPFYGDNIVVLRSNIHISNGVISGFKNAPWCKNIVCSGLQTIREVQSESA